MSFLKHKKLLRAVALAASTAAVVALAWYTATAPQRARNPLAVTMER
jgi:hypothetical protein